METWSAFSVLSIKPLISRLRWSIIPQPDPFMAGSYPIDLARQVHAELLARKEKAPDVRVLQRLFETLYFASLKREEAEPISCRIAFIYRQNPDPKPPNRIVANRWKHFPLLHDLPLTVPNLVKLSKAVDPWGSTLAVDCDAEGRLNIWALIDQSVHFSTYVMKETSVGPEMPGMFQAVIHGVGEIAAYKRFTLLGSLRQNVLVTEQQRVLQLGRVRSKLNSGINDCGRRVTRQVGSRIHEASDLWDEQVEDFWISALCRILIGIQRYGHGGAVLISDNDEGLSPKYSLRYSRLRDALVRVATYTIRGSYHSDRISEYLDQDADEIPAELYLNEAVSTADLHDANDELTGCIRFLTSLSRVDGLIWLDSTLSLKAFGVEIVLKEDPSRVFRALDPLGNHKKKLDLEHFGMRHRSMIRYCNANPTSVGFVVSQDGDVRAVTKVKDAVHLWENVRIQSVLIPRNKHKAKT